MTEYIIEDKIVSYYFFTYICPVTSKNNLQIDMVTIVKLKFCDSHNILKLRWFMKINRNLKEKPSNSMINVHYICIVH